MAIGLLDQILSKAAQIEKPDGTACRGLSVSSVQAISKENGLPIRKIEIEALKNGVLPIRYLRNQKSISTTDQVRLLEAKAAIIGLGGLGGHVAETLARAGVGRLVLVDGDRFEDHNLNRQLFSTRETLGKTKAEAAAARLAEVNAAVSLTVYGKFLSSTNAAELIAQCDVAVDCLDNIMSRFDLETATKKLGIPMVSAAVAGMTGHVTTVFEQDIGIAQIYGARETVTAPKGAETVLGCPPQIVSLIAAVESSEVIKVLLKKENHLLRNKLWVADLTDNTFEVLTLG